MPTSSFVGAWRLVAGETITGSGEINHPFGEDAAGYLIYSPDGYMSVHIMQANRNNFASADFRAGNPNEKAAAFGTYLSYCGTYEVKGDQVVHHIEISLFPNWSGTDQTRIFELSGDELIIRTAPMTIEGMEQTAQLIWRRVARR